MKFVLNFVGLVPLYHRAFAGILLVQKFHSWVSRGSQISSPGNFVNLKLFLVGICGYKRSSGWYFFGTNFFSLMFCGSQFFSPGNFVSLKLILEGFLWVQNFFS